MEQWLILSNVVYYVQYKRHPKNFYNLDIRAGYQKRHKKFYNKEEERQILDLDFGDTPEKLKRVISTIRFDENSDINTTYLGKIGTTKTSKIKAEERFLISEQGYTIGKLLDGTECQILFNTGASKSFMSKSHYLHCKSLHSLLKFASKTQRIQGGSGQFVSVLFTLPIIIDIHGHKFEIYILVSEIHEGVALVFGTKNIFELEGIINSWESCFSFLSRLITFFPREQVILKPKEQKLIKVEAPFVDEISELAIIKVLDKNAQNTMMFKLKFIGNMAVLDVMNSGLETVIFDLKEMSGILDLRLMGYYKIKQGILQQNLNKYYKFESADTICEHFNRFINTLKKEREEVMQEKYPWLDLSDERKCMTKKY